MKLPQPQISIVIPVYNEEGILRSSVNDLIVELEKIGRSIQIVLVENGSNDNTWDIARQLSKKHDIVTAVSIPAANYGLSQKKGIEISKGQYVICDEIDICDVDFYIRSLELLDSGKADFVVGSKAMKGSLDKRPFSRRLATRIINKLLNILVGFKGTDTHGLKAFVRQTVMPVVADCVMDRDLFSSELVIRSWSAGLKVVEIPVDIVEKRPPSINLIKRVPHVMKDLVRLFAAIRFGR